MLQLLADPQAWVALLTLTVLEIVLGIDNVIFIAVLVSPLDEADANRARRIGLTLALVFRILLLFMLTWLLGLNQPVIEAIGRGFIARQGFPSGSNYRHRDPAQQLLPRNALPRRSQIRTEGTDILCFTAKQRTQFLPRRTAYIRDLGPASSNVLITYVSAANSSVLEPPSKVRSTYPSSTKDSE